MMTAKDCKYHCGKKIIWDNSRTENIKFVEVDTGILHNYKRCGDLLKEQGKELIKEPKKK